MTTTDQAHDGEGADYGWERIGRAAQDFARRVARDAGKFAERMEEHAGEFARDVSRDWHRVQRECRRARRHTAAPDVRQVFEDIRTVLSDVLDGVDELIEQLFRAPAERPDADWVRVVLNRAATCGSCSREIGAGEEGFVRQRANDTEFRCVTCGAAPPAAGSAD